MRYVIYLLYIYHIYYSDYMRNIYNDKYIFTPLSFLFYMFCVHLFWSSSFFLYLYLPLPLLQLSRMTLHMGSYIDMILKISNLVSKSFPVFIHLLVQVHSFLFNRSTS